MVTCTNTKSKKHASLVKCLWGMCIHRVSLIGNKNPHWYVYGKHNSYPGNTKGITHHYDIITKVSTAILWYTEVSEVPTSAATANENVSYRSHVTLRMVIGWLFSYYVAIMFWNLLITRFPFNTYIVLQKLRKTRAVVVVSRIARPLFIPPLICRRHKIENNKEEAWKAVWLR